MIRGNLSTVFAPLIMGATLLLLANCGASGKARIQRTSYVTDIRPIMLRSCTPCHFPEKGKKKLLHTYEATRDNIKIILDRVQLPVDHEKFMPFKNKRQALSDAEIALLKLWYDQEMPK